MAHDDSLNAFVRESSYLDMALLSVRNGQHACAFRVQGTQAIRIVTSVQAIDQCQISEVVNVCFDGQDDDHTVRKRDSLG